MNKFRITNNTLNSTCFDLWGGNVIHQLTGITKLAKSSLLVHINLFPIVAALMDFFLCILYTFVHYLLHLYYTYPGTSQESKNNSCSCHYQQYIVRKV